MTFENLQGLLGHPVFRPNYKPHFIAETVYKLRIISVVTPSLIANCVLSIVQGLRTLQGHRSRGSVILLFFTATNNLILPLILIVLPASHDVSVVRRGRGDVALSRNTLMVSTSMPRRSQTLKIASLKSDI